MATKRTSHSTSAKAAAKFADNLRLFTQDSESFLDSVSAASDAIETAITGQNSLGVPDGFAQLLDEVGTAGKAPVIAAFLDSIADYETQHNQAPSPDLLEFTLNAAYQQTRNNIKRNYAAAGAILDDASNMLPENGAMQANRAIVSITTALTSAIPWATTLPTDIGSGEAKLIIVNHNATNHFGQYEAGANIDGINSGRAYITSSRFDKIVIGAGGTGTGQLTSVQTDSDNCAAVAGDVVAVKLVKGASVVYANGHQVAKEVTTQTAVSNLSGSVTLSNVTYSLSGTVNTDTGEISVASSPALPNGSELIVEGIIDYNRQSAIIPSIGLDSSVYSLFASPWRASAMVGVDARTQFNNEAGIDPMSQLMAALQRQLMNEKHYLALTYGRRLALENQASFAIDTWLATGAQTREQSIENISIPLGAVSQKMAVNTNSYGVSHVYCGQKVKSWLNLLKNSSRFVSSGIRDYPGIHRIGTLDGIYEFYYSPSINETTDGNDITTAELLCVGQSQDVARSAVVMGQAVSPLLLPTNRTLNLDEGVGYFEKTFIKPNPHTPSAKGFALITLTGLK